LKYDSQNLANALSQLSRAEIDDMLGHISALEHQLIRLQTDGHDDDMLQLVTDGLFRLTYVLDAVKQHKSETGDNR
jgi:hypothetical protein